MDWKLWCLAGEHSGDVGDPRLSDDDLSDSVIQSWRPTNFEAGAIWAFEAGRPGDLLVDF